MNNLTEEQKARQEEMHETGVVIKWGVLGLFFLVLLIVSGMMGCPRYKVYQQNLRGKADLAEATQNRQIAIQEAMAKFESAVYIKQSDSTRAVGVAIANKIIGQSLKENEDYLRWLWITDVAGASVDKTIVYIPTETNLPILEANRFYKPPIIEQTIEKK
jgi:hypothetical protein